jgi:glycosyltransferase involved in cell wall biosynthesis
VHHFSGYLLRLARSVRVPVRISHSHSDTSLLDARSNWSRQSYLRLMERWIHRYATGMAAVSTQAGECLFGEGWKRDSRSRVVNCGVDLSAFPQGAAKEAARARARAAWKIPPEAFVVGHVGRFDPPKNHEFLLKVAIETMRRDSTTMLLLVGDGPLRETLRARVRQAALDDRVIFAGVTQNVPELLEAMDAFLFPSSYEGLGLALVEAQATGLPCVTSEAVPEEAFVIPELAQRVNLHESSAVWADALTRARKQGRLDSCKAWRSVQRSPLNIERSVEQLYALYNA